MFFHYKIHSSQCLSHYVTSKKKQLNLIKTGHESKQKYNSFWFDCTQKSFVSLLNEDELNAISKFYGTDFDKFWKYANYHKTTLSQVQDYRLDWPIRLPINRILLEYTELWCITYTRRHFMLLSRNQPCTSFKSLFSCEIFQTLISFPSFYSTLIIPH